MGAAAAHGHRAQKLRGSARAIRSSVRDDDSSLSNHGGVVLADLAKHDYVLHVQEMPQRGARCHDCLRKVARQATYRTQLLWRCEVQLQQSTVVVSPFDSGRPIPNSRAIMGSVMASLRASFLARRASSILAIAPWFRVGGLASTEGW